MADRSRSQQLRFQDLWGTALWDHYLGVRHTPLFLHTSYGAPELVALEIFFRHKWQLPELEAYALELCRGSILDVGAGAGCHSWILQEDRKTVTALEISPGACKVMRHRGIQRIVQEDLYQYQGETFDTVLILMNGLGLARTLSNLQDYLKLIGMLLKPNGQILLDSCDIRYLYPQGVEEGDLYHGELQYAYQYGEITDPQFSWLFADAELLKVHGEQAGLQVQILFEEDSQYLARLILSR